MRWRHPGRDVLLPDSFIGVAESMDLTGDLPFISLKPTAGRLRPRVSLARRGFRTFDVASINGMELDQGRSGVDSARIQSW